MSGPFFDSGAMKDSFDRKTAAGIGGAGLASLVFLMVSYALGTKFVQWTSKRPAVAYFVLSWVSFLPLWTVAHQTHLLPLTARSASYEPMYVIAIASLVTGSIFVAQAVSYLRVKGFFRTDTSDWFDTPFWLFSSQMFDAVMVGVLVYSAYQIGLQYIPVFTKQYGPYLTFLVPVWAAFGFWNRRVGHALREIRARDAALVGVSHEEHLQAQASWLLEYKRRTRLTIWHVPYFLLVAIFVTFLVSLMNNNLLDALKPEIIFAYKVAWTIYGLFN